jgi:hypothetical protein
LKDHGLLAGMLRITQGRQRGPGVVVERYLAVLSPLAVADRQQTFTIRGVTPPLVKNCTLTVLHLARKGSRIRPRPTPQDR